MSIDAFIETIRMSDKTTQALAVTGGGLIGVFTTLFVFFVIIAVADKFGKKTGEK